MTRARSLILKIILRVLLVIGLALIIIMIPNLPIFDEKLLPEISQRLNNRPNPNVEGNAYYYIYGMAAASDKNPDAVGKAVMQTLQAKHAKGEMANLSDTETIALYGAKENGDSEWQTMLASNCVPRLRSDCFAHLLADIKDKTFNQARLLVQIERYQHVINLPHLIEDMSGLDYTSPLPNFFFVMKIGEFKQAKAYQESGLDGLIASSESDMHFWRMALSEGQTLIGKMVSIASLRRNLDALSYAIKNTAELTPEQIYKLHALLKPLSQDEISMEKKLVAELAFNVENMQATKKITADEPTLLWLLTQPMASTNWFYRQTLKPAFAFNAMSAPEFYARAQTPTKPLEFSRFNPYNLGGKIYQSKNWQYAAYIGRAHDLANIYSLVSLQVELKTKQPNDVTMAIKTSAYKNTYTQKSFDYDSASKELSFTCFDTKDLCKIAL